MNLKWSPHKLVKTRLQPTRKQCDATIRKNSCLITNHDFICSIKSSPQHPCLRVWMTKRFFMFFLFLFSIFISFSLIRLSHLSSHQLLSQPSENLLKKKASNKFSSIKIKKMKRELPKMRNDHECESVKHYGRHKIIISFLKRVKAAQNSKKNHQDHHQWWTGMMENIFTNISSDIQVLKCFFDDFCCCIFTIMLDIYFHCIAWNQSWEVFWGSTKFDITYQQLATMVVQEFY